MGSKVVGARGALDGASSGAGRCEFAPVGAGVTWGLGWAYLATEGGEGGEKEGGISYPLGRRGDCAGETQLVPRPLVLGSERRRLPIAQHELSWPKRSMVPAVIGGPGVAVRPPRGPWSPPGCVMVSANLERGTDFCGTQHGCPRKDAV